MIKVIIFDFGGVILQHRTDLVPYFLSQMFPSGAEEISSVWKEIKISLNTGKLTFEELLIQLKNTTKSDKALKELVQMWQDLYKKEAKDVNWRLLDLIERLKNKYKVYLFTDTIKTHDDINSKRGLYDKFHGVYKSFEEGISKHAGKDAFYHVLKKIGAKSEECVFIDDLASNVKSAESIGMKALLFTGNEQLEKDLKQLGIKI